MEHAPATEILEFDDFELNPRARTLHRGGVPVTISSKVFEALIILVRNHGQVVDKDALMQTIWPDTAVEEGNLHQCVSSLRRALGERADERRFIATIPGRGYSFVATVRIRNRKTEPRRLTWVWISCAAAAVSLIPAVWFFSGRMRQSRVARPIPLMATPGVAESPTFSPESDQIAFSWRSGADGNAHLYVKTLGSESIRQLTSGRYSDSSPSWSPDGKLIAFFRRQPPSDDLSRCIVPAAGGDVRVLHIKKVAADGGIQESWSADSKRIFFAEKPSLDTPARLNSLSIETGEVRPITAPPGWVVDLSPAVSPDGGSIAFLRAIEGGWTIQAIPSKGGNPKQILGPDQNADRAALAWTPDSRHVIYRSGLGGLWEASLSGGRPQRLQVGSDSANFPAVSRHGDLAFIESYQQMALEQIAIASDGGAPVERTIFESTRSVLSPQWSPDGKQIAFYSDRSGSTEIWKCNSDGSNAKQLTFGGSFTTHPRWSPDGKTIAFDSVSGGKGHLHLIGSDGGPDRQITNGDFDDYLPAWNNDGTKLYCTSRRSGTSQIWTVSISGSAATQVTFLGGFFPAVSTDDYLYYVRAPGDRSLLRMRVGGGAEETVLEAALGDSAWWALAAGGIFYIDRYAALRYFDVASRRSSAVLKQFQHEALRRFSTIGVSGDGRAVLCPVLIRSFSDVMLVRHFW